MKQVRSGTRAAFWREALVQWAESGLAQVEFCQMRGLSLKTFRRYRSQLAEPSSQCKKRHPPKPLRESASFIEVSLRARQSQAVDSVKLEVRLSNGRRIGVSAGFDRRTLLELVKTLESSQC